MVILWAEIVQLAVASAWLRHFGQVIISSSPEKLFVGYHWAQKMYLARSLVSQDGLIVLGFDLEGRSIQGAPLWPQQREQDWESWVRSVRRRRMRWPPMSTPNNWTRKLGVSISKPILM